MSTVCLSCQSFAKGGSVGQILKYRVNMGVLFWMSMFLCVLNVCVCVCVYVCVCVCVCV